MMTAAVLVIDIDRFRAINESHGSAVGDRLLHEVQSQLVTACPSGALVSRVEADTFSVGLPCAAGDPRRLSEYLNRAIRSREFIDGIRLTASIGIAVSPDAASLGNGELLQRADRAMFAAKARGRDCAVDYDDLVQRAESRNGRVELDVFDDVVQVLADRIAMQIAGRGRRILQQLRDEADRDALTGLYARRYLDRRLSYDLKGADATALTLALIDVDHFRMVNKAHGWPSGDRVLVEIAARIRAALRATDWVARYGGEEFCVVLRGATAEDSIAVLERVRESVAATPIGLPTGGSCRITISAGAARLLPGEDPGALVGRASDLLLAAKRGGRNRVCGHRRSGPGAPVPPRIGAMSEIACKPVDLAP